MREPKIGVILRKCFRAAQGDKTCECEICTGKLPSLQAAEKHGKFIEAIFDLIKEGQ